MKPNTGLSALELACSCHLTLISSIKISRSNCYQYSRSRPHSQPCAFKKKKCFIGGASAAQFSPTMLELPVKPWHYNSCMFIVVCFSFILSDEEVVLIFPVMNNTCKERIAWSNTWLSHALKEITIYVSRLVLCTLKSQCHPREMRCFLIYPK